MNSVSSRLAILQRYPDSLIESQISPTMNLGIHIIATTIVESMRYFVIPDLLPPSRHTALVRSLLAKFSNDTPFVEPPLPHKKSLLSLSILLITHFGNLKHVMK